MSWVTTYYREVVTQPSYPLPHRPVFFNPENSPEFYTREQLAQESTPHKIVVSLERKDGRVRSTLASIFHVTAEQIATYFPYTNGFKLSDIHELTLSERDIQESVFGTFARHKQLEICDFRFCNPMLPDLSNLFNIALATNLRMVFLPRELTASEEHTITNVNRLVKGKKLTVLVENTVLKRLSFIFKISQDRSRVLIKLHRPQNYPCQILSF